MASTVSDATRNDTWEMILDLERQVRYYGKLAGDYSMKYRTIRYFLLFGVLAEGAAVYFLSGQDPLLLWGTAGLGAFTLGFITVFDAVTNYAETGRIPQGSAPAVRRTQDRSGAAVARH